MDKFFFFNLRLTIIAQPNIFTDTTVLLKKQNMPTEFMRRKAF